VGIGRQGKPRDTKNGRKKLETSEEGSGKRPDRK
jgi:hypothetical protein